MFDLMPGEVHVLGFFIAQGLRWTGYLLFLGFAWHLGRRVHDYMIPGLALAALVLPEFWSEAMGVYRRIDSDLSLRAWASLSFGSLLLQIALFGVLITRSARRVAEVRSEVR